MVPDGGGRQGSTFGPRHHTSVKMSKRPRSVVVVEAEHELRTATIDKPPINLISR
jgi:hypothetical protein